MVFLGGGRGACEEGWCWDFGFRGRDLKVLEAVALGWSGAPSLLRRARPFASGSESGMRSPSSSIGGSSSTFLGGRLDLAVAREAVAVPVSLVLSWATGFGSDCFLLVGRTGIPRLVDFLFPF